jgi:hypothetical protein
MSKYSIRKYCIYSLLAVVPLGFLFKFYSGPGRRWFNDFGAGLFYEIFWILIVFLILPKKKLVNKIPLWVFLITCALEVLQLWHPKFLEAIRSFFIGAALIGTTFSWWDFPHYAIGCYLGWLWIIWLNERKKMGSLSGSMC